MTDTTHRDDHVAITAAQRDLLGHVLDKWSIGILNELCTAPRRFNELRRALPGITQKSLAATLRRLERSGIVEREVVATRPVAVRYSISPLGKTLREPVDGLVAWAAEHLSEVERARTRYDDTLDA
jgi:DNA-binding HxlR family transcriptional regulator